MYYSNFTSYADKLKSGKGAEFFLFFNRKLNEAFFRICLLISCLWKYESPRLGYESQV